VIREGNAFSKIVHFNHEIDYYNIFCSQNNYSF
jgi:hypothetical protein